MGARGGEWRETLSLAFFELPTKNQAGKLEVAPICTHSELLLSALGQTWEDASAKRHAHL
jgi:hypothetical protein